MAKDATAGSPASDVNEDDYEALLTTLSASALGRAFLAEFARRNRAADTDMLLAAIARLEASIAAQRPPAAEVPVDAATADTLVKPNAGEASVEAVLAEAPAEPATAEAPSEPADAAAEATAVPEMTWTVELSLPAEQCEVAAAAPEAPPPETAPVPPRDASEAATPRRDPLTQIMALSEDERVALFS
jgi:hypothetical protein